MRMNEHPKGAILTEAALQALIPTGNERAIIYDVNGVYPSVYELTLTSDSAIETNSSGFREISMAGRYGPSTRCLGDWNIDANHNANYVFASREDAESYSAFAATDPEMANQRQEHLEECRRWDDLFDHCDHDYPADEYV